MRKWLLLMLAAPFAFSPAYAVSTVSIMADSNLSLALAMLVGDYARQTGVVVNVSLASVKAQQAQITEGGTADALITPRQEWIDELKIRGLIDFYSQIPVAQDRLALVGAADSTLRASLHQGFPVAALIRELGWEPGFLVGNPETLAEGVSAKEALRNMGAAEDLEEYTLYIKDQAEMLSVIETQKAYGVLFYSAAAGRPNVRIVDVFPEGTHRPIQYYAVVLAGDNMDEARKFLKYLMSREAKLLLQGYGFVTD